MIRTGIEDGVAVVTLSHPPLNILNRDLLAALRQALAGLAGDARVVVLAADGKHFSAGADVGEHLPPQHERLIPEFLDTVRAIAEFPAPVIAAVNGKCLGGGFELAQAADLIVAGLGSSFGQPEIVLGVTPPAACALLPGLCGPALAAELILTGDPIGAGRALESGLAARVVPDERVDAEARALAARMARHSGAALRLAKRTLHAAVRRDRAAALADAGAIYLNELMHTRDAIEGLRAFAEKRRPAWTHG